MKKIKKKNIFKNYFLKYSELINSIDQIKIKKLIQNFILVKKRRKKILFFGNGAGAAIASHVSSDGAKSIGIKSLSFDNSAHITCFSNDYGFKNWIKKTIENYAEKSDLVILLSASGNSQNMIEAARFMNKNKINFYSLTGFKKENRLKKISKNFFWINSKSYNHVEVLQSIILLSVIDAIKKR